MTAAVSVQAAREQKKAGVRLTSGMKLGTSFHAMMHAVRSIDFANMASESSTKLTKEISPSKLQSKTLRDKQSVIIEAEQPAPQCLDFSRSFLKKLFCGRTSSSEWEAKEVIMCRLPCGNYTWRLNDGTPPVCKVCKVCKEHR